MVQGDQSGKEPPLATPAADVWALGVIAYEVLCGMLTRSCKLGYMFTTSDTASYHVYFWDR